MLVALCVVVVLVLAAAGGLVYMGSWRMLIRRRVLVVLDGDRTIEGVLWRQRGPLLVLRNCVIYANSTNGHPADGEVVVERSRVAWIQAAAK